MDYIKVRGARENNLKNIDIDIPKNKLVVFTGLSGSGKTSLAFDTIFAEGQRRYVESLSSYARQFLGNIDKPDVDSIEGLSPAISIDQKTTSKNPRSTVGTVTEIYDYLRLLYGKIGISYCPRHNIKIEQTSIKQMVDRVFTYRENAKVYIYAPVVNHKKGQFKKELEAYVRNGYSKALIDGELVDLETVKELNRTTRHNIDILLDRLKLNEKNRSRLYDSIEQATELANGLCMIQVDNETFTLSEKYVCPECDFTIKALEPRLFSFNAALGGCPECNGLGTIQTITEELVIDESKNFFNGGIIPYSSGIDKSSILGQQMLSCMKACKIDPNKKIKNLSLSEKNIMFYGSKKNINMVIESRSGTKTVQDRPYEGIINYLQRRLEETSSDWVKKWLSKYVVETECSTCHGARLNEQALSVKVGGKNIYEFTKMNPGQAISFLDALQLTEREATISKMIIRELKDRLAFLKNVGLNYLTLDRRSATLSGGEAQRIRLATQIGSKLSGVLYVLDEPSIGLHPADSDKLYKTLRDMVKLDNSMIVVEHDEELMRKCDYIIDVGPYAGEHGGKIVAYGTPQELMNNFDSITAKYLRKEYFIPVPKTYRKLNKKFTVKGASENNLKNIDVDFYISCLNVVTGVSGSGKSSLVNDILYKTAARDINHAKIVPGKCKKIVGLNKLERVVNIDQSPIGRTPRSNPATYTKVFDDIRELFARTNEAKKRGYTKSRFSFNIKGGRCETCKGDGVSKISMGFLPDVYVECDECKGKRYNRETLEVKYKGKTIADVLDMTIEEAATFFENIPKISKKLKIMNDVGIGYIKLGQSSTTLSGGESQRVKIASELYRDIDDKSLYILDEPTTGLHSYDVNRLINILQTMVSKGATVVVIEHNLDVIKQADNIIDLGPDGGDYGGNLVANGPISKVLEKDTYTSKYLRSVLK